MSSRYSSPNVPMVTVSFKLTNKPFGNHISNPNKMVILQKHENQVYADIVRTLKQNFRTEVQTSSNSETHCERKVRIRNECYYKSQTLDDHWRERYNRHVKQSVRGFYTPAHVPYASVGDVCLDIKDLVLNTVGCGQADLEKVSIYKLKARRQRFNNIV